ncbi:MAG: hypothetical protein FJX67_18050 [Alphaproteobacteria bacterium]|nr:hypothetical protein [Alphaproteobacteria bacterium]
MVSLLARDDVDAARQFQQFYAGFLCPAAHIGETFGCIIADATVPEARALALRVDACWSDPTIELSSIVDPEADKAKAPAASPAQPAARPPADAGQTAPGSGNNRR